MECFEFVKPVQNCGIKLSSSVMASHSVFDFSLVNKFSFHNSTGVLDFSPSLREEH